MKVKPIQIVVLLAALSLAGLLVIQVHWFHKALLLEEKQFNEKVNLALRSVANEILSEKGDHTSRIPPVSQRASNAFAVHLQVPVAYDHLLALLSKHFAYYGIQEDYQLALREATSPLLVLGGLVKMEAEEKITIPCLTRNSMAAAYDFSVTFPSKDLYLAGGMQIWYGTALTFLLVLFFFSYTAVVILKEKKLSAMKRDFINNMTHELKTPLASISLASEVLRKPHPGIDVGKSSHYADLIYQETQRLQLQVDHVLQIARLEKEHLALTMTAVDVHQLIAHVLDTVDIRIQQRNGVLHSELKAKSAVILGDEHHLKNVFYNLLDNADKYSPGIPQITVMTHNQADQLVISIVDKGMGISRKAQPKIFDTFYRIPGGNVHETPGVGLGLSYVKSVMKAHKGNIQVESQVDQGSLFNLFFHCA